MAYKRVEYEETNQEKKKRKKNQTKKEKTLLQLYKHEAIQLLYLSTIGYCVDLVLCLRKMRDEIKKQSCWVCENQRFHPSSRRENCNFV